MKQGITCCIYVSSPLNLTLVNYKLLVSAIRFFEYSSLVKVHVFIIIPYILLRRVYILNFKIVHNFDNIIT